jgi:aryl-alcohol dehydrogenase-like predicted oxidoreductase
MAELARLREKGKARAIGTSNFNLTQMAVAAQHGAAVLQPPFNPLWRLIDGDVLPFCRENKVAVTPYRPLAQGLMTGRYTRADSTVTGSPRKANRLFREPVFTRAMEAACVVDAVADETGATSSRVTLAWCLATPGVTAPIVGISRMAQWKENMGALEVALTDEQYRAISEAGLRVWRELPDDASMWG